MNRYSFDEFRESGDASDDDDTLLFNTSKYLEAKAHDDARAKAEEDDRVRGEDTTTSVQQPPTRRIVEIVRDDRQQDNDSDEEGGDFDSDMQKVRAQRRIQAVQHDAAHKELDQKRRATDLRKVVPLEATGPPTTGRGGARAGSSGARGRGVTASAPMAKASSARVPTTTAPSASPVPLTANHRIFALQDEIKGLTNQVQHQGRALTRLTEENEKQAKLITTMNQKIDREASEAKKYQHQLKLAEAQVTTLKKELEVATTSQPSSKAGGGGGGDTVPALKARVMELEQRLANTSPSHHPTATAGSDDVSTLRHENKKLDQQRVELLVCIRKQNKLIEVLRRQKLHLEASKLLELTEGDFTRALEITDA